MKSELIGLDPPEDWNYSRFRFERTELKKTNMAYGAKKNPHGDLQMMEIKSIGC